MDVREKLVELIGQVQDCGCDVTDVVEMNYVENITLADHLIANGVTVQKWISVKDRLPDNENQRVLAVCIGDYPIGHPKIDTDRYTRGHWVRYGNDVTHWMPLPQPPKGE